MEEDLQAGETRSYAISARILSTRPHPISGAEFQRLSQAAEDLLACLNLEEAYEVVILNYVSLEKAMVSAVVDFMVDRRSSRPSYDRARREIDRQLVNLVASGEMYAEHVSKTVRRLQRANRQRGIHIEAAQIDEAFKEQRTRLVGMRAVEALRNHVLHLSLPVSGWTQNNAWIGDDPASKLRHSFSVDFSASRLRADRQVSPQLIEELKDRADKNGRIPWLPVVREYIEGLSYAHAAVRKCLGPLEVGAEALIAEAIAAYRMATSMPDETKGAMGVAEIDGEGRWVSEVSIDFDYQARVEDMRSRNRAPLVNLRRREILG